MTPQFVGINPLMPSIKFRDSPQTFPVQMPNQEVIKLDKTNGKEASFMNNQLLVIYNTVISTNNSL